MTETNRISGLAYANALEELETILARLERDDADVDRIAEDVERASQLISHLRSKIESTKLSVQHVVAEMKTSVTNSSGTNSSSGLDDLDDEYTTD